MDKLPKEQNKECNIPCIFGKNKITFINIDSDIYSSAKCVLETLKHYIANGCIINFREITQR